jgi:hypothetical protein
MKFRIPDFYLHEHDSAILVESLCTYSVSVCGALYILQVLFVLMTFFYFIQFLYLFLLCILVTVLVYMLQVLSSVLSSVMEYDRSVYNKLWVVLCGILTSAPLKIKSQALKLATSILKKVGFTMDVKVRVDFMFYFLK